MQNRPKDSATIGAIIGIVLPLIIACIVLLVANNNFDSFQATYNHFKFYGLLYKVLSASLMPNALLFFLWSKQNKLNQARSILLMTLFYGVFVMFLYFQ